MYGTYYNYLKQHNERDIFILKVNKDGLLLSNDEISTSKTNSVIIFPNPGDDVISIHLTPPGYYIFTLLDISGKMVYSKEIFSASFNMDVSFINPGIYLYRIINEKKIISSGKWIKK